MWTHRRRRTPPAWLSRRHRCRATRSESACLDALRTSAMTRCRNIARTDVLLGIASELECQPQLNAAQFSQDLCSEAARAAFTTDFGECRRREVGRFPTFLIEGPRPSRVVVGYRPIELFVDVLRATGLRNRTSQ